MKKKLKTFYKNYMNIIYTFLAAIVIIGVVYYLQKVKPFGNHSMLTIDFFHQYGPMLSEMYDRIKSGSNIIYSFSMGMGLPFFRNFFNYLSSPFNLIMFLFNHKDVIMSYSFIIGLKAAFATATMMLYLNKKFDYKGLFLIPISLLYGFNAYFTAFYWNIMWLDGLVFLPLIVLGIERLISLNKPILYILSLTIMLFANYFIGYMLCVFSVIYFIAYLIINTKEFKIKKILKKIWTFCWASLLAGGLVACFLIPMYFALNSISATGEIIPSSQYYAFTLQEYLFNHFSGVSSTVLGSDIANGPNISSGILSIGLFLLFIINPKINIKVKITYLLILLLLAFSFQNAQLDFIWHAFHVPNDLPFRYSFIYSFVFISISGYALINLKHLKFSTTLIVYIFTMGLISLLHFLKYESINEDMILLNFAALTIYFLLYCLYIFFKHFKIFIPIFFIITVVLESIVSISNNWNISQDINGFYSDYNNITSIVKHINKYDNDMYRIDRTSMLTFNDPSWYGYYGQTTFSSMEYEGLAYLQHSLGLPGNEINSFRYEQTTPIYDLMYNIKYLIGVNKDKERYTLFHKQGMTEVYKNNYNLGLLYGVNSNIKNWQYTLTSPFEIQNDYIQKATNINENVLKKVNISTTDILYDKDFVVAKYTVKNPKENLYFYFDDSNIDFIIIDKSLYYNTKDYEYINKVFNVEVENIQTYNEKYILNTSTDDDYYTFYVGYNNYFADNILIYTLDQTIFDQAYTTLKDSQITITSFKESNILATSNFDSDLTVYTSIPYDLGWQVYIDRKKTNTFKIGDALLAFDLKAGDHKIELKYSIPYFKISVLVSTVSFAILIGYVICKKNKSK